MRNSFKKILSFLLVIGIMAGSFVFAMPALADSGVVLETNGGTLADTTPIEAGANLPTYEGITRNGCTFGGWFTNADFTGAQSFVAAANTTYYARWVDPTVLQNFDSWSDSDYSSKVTMHKYKGTEATTGLNTDSANALSGNKSARVGPIQNNNDNGKHVHLQDTDAARFYGSEFELVQTGYYFWVYNNSAFNIKIRIYIPWTEYYELTIPAGTKQLISANKKTSYGGAADDLFRIIICSTDWNRASNLYFDDIGTFTDVPYVSETPVTLVTNGGTLADTTPIEAGALLPTYEGITRGNLAFGGWFTNADFTGAQSFVAAANTTYYARWVDPTVLQNFDSWDPATYASSTSTYKYHGGTTAATTLNTDSAFAFSGNNSAHVYNVDWSANDDKCFHIEDEYFGTGLANVTTGYYFWVHANVDVKISVYIPWSIAYTYTIPAGTKQLITANKKTAYGDGFRIIFHKALTSKGKVWIDDIGTFTDVTETPVEPSFGMATSGNVALFAPGDSENAGIVGGTAGSAVYKIDDVEYTAFRVFGTYVAPDNNGAPDFGKVVVAENDVRDIVSRHIMLGYNKAPTIENNYTMTTATADFDKCWGYVQNEDGSWTVTYSLLLKNIPEEYVETAFNVKSAIVTAAGTIVSDEMTEGVSAKAIYDAIPGEKPGWFN